MHFKLEGPLKTSPEAAAVPDVLMLMDEVWTHSGRSRPGRASHSCRSSGATGVRRDRFFHLHTINVAPEPQMCVIWGVRLEITQRWRWF